MRIPPHHACIIQSGWKWGSPSFIVGVWLMYLGIAQQLPGPNPGGWEVALKVMFGCLLLWVGAVGVSFWYGLRGEDLDRAAAADHHDRSPTGAVKG